MKVIVDALVKQINLVVSQTEQCTNNDLNSKNEMIQDRNGVKNTNDSTTKVPPPCSSLSTCISWSQNSNTRSVGWEEGIFPTLQSLENKDPGPDIKRKGA